MKGLVLDGGGVFGVGQAHIISSIDCLDKFDFFVGTSIGSACALAIAHGKQDKVLDLFYEQMPKIFSGYKYRNYIFWKNRHNDKNLNKVLFSLFTSSFGNSKKPTFITAVNMPTNRLKVFNSLNTSDSSWPAWEVVRTSVAAPTYFTPWKGYIDGGVYVNNPSMVATTAAINNLNINLSDLEIFSIGTGESIKERNIPANNQGRVGWGLWILQSLLRGGSNSMHEYFTRSLSLKKYERIQFIRKPHWNINNPEHMLEAVKVWEKNIETGIRCIKNF